jgi:hypothetical protein
MTSTAHEDQYAPEPVSDPVFETQAELEAWAKGVRYRANRKMESTKPSERAIIAASRDARIRRVTLAHLHLRDTKADSDGDDGA